MSAEPKLTEQDYELLSAYLDGELTGVERSALESRLQTEDSLRQELEVLRQTVALVNQLPTLKAPRDFTLTPAMVRQPQIVPHRQPLYMRPAVWSAAAAVVVLIFGALFVLSSADLNQPRAFDKAAESMDDSAPALGQVAVVPTPMPTLEMQQTEQLSDAAAAIPPVVSTFDQDILRNEINPTTEADSDLSGGEAPGEGNIPPAPVTGYALASPDANEIAENVQAEEENRMDGFFGSAASNQAVVPADAEEAGSTAVMEQPMVAGGPSAGGGGMLSGPPDSTLAGAVPVPDTSTSGTEWMRDESLPESTESLTMLQAAEPTVLPLSVTSAATGAERSVVEPSLTETSTETPKEIEPVEQKSSRNRTAVMGIMIAAALVLLVSTYFMLRGRNTKS
jgi:hypothetical protein